MRGFAKMSKDQQFAIASKGGKAAHAKGTAHKFNHDEAVAAGSKGGTSVSKNREYMRELGRKGAAARNAARSGTFDAVEL